MNCKYCNADAKCIDSRPTHYGRWRRYRCLSTDCGRRFTTVELHLKGNTSHHAKPGQFGNTPINYKALEGVEVKSPLTNLFNEQQEAAVQAMLDAFKGEY